MTFKVRLELNVEMTQETMNFYRENPADFHEAIATSEKARLTCELTHEKPDEDWQ